ncbi:MAG: hypothetical protein ACI8Y7_000590 [Candidatus Woesearchaeota archaeon]|jgi:hypothetical protein
MEELVKLNKDSVSYWDYTSGSVHSDVDLKDFRGGKMQMGIHGGDEPFAYINFEAEIYYEDFWKECLPVNERLEVPLQRISGSQFRPDEVINVYQTLKLLYYQELWEIHDAKVINIPASYELVLGERAFEKKLSESNWFKRVRHHVSRHGELKKFIAKYHLTYLHCYYSVLEGGHCRLSPHYYPSKLSGELLSDPSDRFSHSLPYVDARDVGGEFVHGQTISLDSILEIDF